MKKKLIKISIYAGVAILVFLIVIGCMFLIEKNKVNKMLNKFEKAYNGSDTSIIFYASATCHFCETEKPILKTIAADYNLKYVELDVSILSKKQREDINKKLKIEGATPTISIVKNKDVLYTNVGYLDGQDLVDFFIKAGLIEEGSRYLPEENLIYIGLDELKELEDGIVIIGYTSDPDCNKIKEIMNNISSKYELDVYYFNFGKLDEYDYFDAFDYIYEINTNEYTLDEDDKFIFPQIFVIKDSKIFKVIKDVDEKKIINALDL